MSFEDLAPKFDFEDDAEGAEVAQKGDNKAGFVHVRVQQRNGRKCITTVQGLSDQVDPKKVIKAVKKAYCCNGTVVEDDEMGSVMQFQGDQRDNVIKFLTSNEIVDMGKIKKHGMG